MRPKSIILLALALGCGLIASIGINQVLANRNAPAVEAATVDILVAAMDVPMGDPLKPEHVRLQPWPEAQLPEGAVTKFEDAEGRRPRKKFFAGEPILDSMLLGVGDDGESATDLIPKGMRVVAIKVDPETGVSSMILPGDRVDVIVHLEENQARGILRTTSRTFLQNIKVFAVDSVYNDRGRDGEQTIAAKTISLLVTPAQSEMVSMASHLGTIRLSMRAADDDVASDTGGVSPYELFGNSGHTMAADPGPAPADDPNSANSLLDILEQERNRQASNVPSVPEFKMVVIKGDQASEMVFQDGNSLPTASPSVHDNGSPAHNFELPTSIHESDAAPQDVPVDQLPPLPQD